MHEQHQSHTTLPDPITITTQYGARLTVTNRMQCTVKSETYSRGSDGIEHEAISEGRFIVLRHGINYVDHQPASLWLELCPVLDVGNPNGWHGCWLEGHETPSEVSLATRAALTLASEGKQLTDEQRALLTKLIP